MTTFNYLSIAAGITAASIIIFINDISSFAMVSGIGKHVVNPANIVIEGWPLVAFGALVSVTLFFTVTNEVQVTPEAVIKEVKAKDEQIEVLAAKVELSEAQLKKYLGLHHQQHLEIVALTNANGKNSNSMLASGFKELEDNKEALRVKWKEANAQIQHYKDIADREIRGRQDASHRGTRRTNAKQKKIEKLEAELHTVYSARKK